MIDEVYGVNQSPTQLQLVLSAGFLNLVDLRISVVIFVNCDLSLVGFLSNNFIYFLVLTGLILDVGSHRDLRVSAGTYVEPHLATAWAFELELKFRRLSEETSCSAALQGPSQLRWEVVCNQESHNFRLIKQEELNLIISQIQCIDIDFEHQTRLGGCFKRMREYFNTCERSVRCLATMTS